MTRREAQDVLLLSRPGRIGPEEPQMAEALRMAREDAELGAWYERHLAFQAGVTRSLRQLEPPPELKERLLARRRIVRPALWRRVPAWLAAAAAIVLLAALGSFWLQSRTPDRFADFQDRMLRYALREYGMDVTTNDMRAVRQFMTSKGAPADYVLPRGLESVQLAGGGFLRWRNHPVAMVCFERPDRQMLYLFVLDREAVRTPPGPTPQVSAFNRLAAATWSRGRLAYVLAGPVEPDFLRKYFPAD